ncbi:MAG: hypothetical protein GEV06_01930 [Luteitalea sp.]|nr:hypothetical protein [Luteitalea sp.]
MSRLAAVLVLLMAGVSRVSTQATSGTITGLVSDPDGGAVPAAIVAITEVNKGVSFSTKTNDRGYYTHARVPAGEYILTVEKEGFRSFVRENVLLSVDSTLRVDVGLTLGQVSEEVVVTGAAPLLRSERADVSTTLENRVITQVPTVGRNVSNLQLLAPGAVREPGQVGLAENPQGSVSISSNGQPNGARNMQLDGVDNNENVLGGNVVIPTQESVREFRITTSSWDAEFGRAGGALTQVETKSGTNSLHGSVFEFLRNDATNARNPFTEPDEASPLKWNQFGGSVGGPLKKNKTFFFGDYQGQRQRLGGTTVATVPTMPMREGDFSELRDSNGNLIPIFDPLTGDQNGLGRQQLPGNQIPSDRINPVAANLLDLLPAPTNPERIEDNFIASGSTTFDTNQYSGRVDHYVGQNTRLFGRYIYFDSDLFSPPIYGVQAGGPSLHGGVGGVSTGNNHNLSLNLNHVLSPTLLIEARYGYSRYDVQVLHADAGTNFSTEVGLPGINTGDVNTSGLSRIDVTGVGEFSMGGSAACNCPLDQVLNHHQWAATLTWIKGSHTAKFGADIRRYSNLRISNAARRGTFGFTPGVTAAAGVPNSGFATASLLLGETTSFNRQFNLQDNVGHESETHLFGYAQDTWKITPKLTLSYGLRYEIYTPPSTPTGAGSNLDLSTGMVLIAGVGDVSNRVNVRTDMNNVAPRLGLSYLLNEKTVIRAGAGRSYFPNVFNVLVSGNYPLFGNQQILNETTFSRALTLGSELPGFTFPTIPESGMFPLPVGQNMTFNPFDRDTGYVDAWNVTLQRELAPTLSLEVGYVGNVGRDLYFNIPLNLPVPGPGPLDPRRPLFDQFGYTQNIVWRGNSGRSNYHSLQVKVEKRATEDLALVASYAWSKTIDSGTYDVVTDPQNIRNDRGVADRDRASVLTVGHVYELPFGPGKRFLPNATGVVRHMVEGWSFSGLAVFASGLPVMPLMANNSTLNSEFRLRPDLVGDPSVSDPTRDLWFDPAAFVVPDPYRQGTAGRNILRGPSYYNADWSLAKTFRLFDDTQLEFRVDAFNVFNHTNLGQPNNTVDGPGAGQIVDVAGDSTMRQMQFGLRLIW